VKCPFPNRQSCEFLKNLLLSDSRYSTITDHQAFERIVMARITVEDCEKIVGNRFDLVILAAQRTRQILNGNVITIDSKDEKKPVIALREIAAQSVSVEALKESAIKCFRTFISEEDNDDLEDNLEEDTYNPHIGMDMAQIESQMGASMRVVDSIEEGDEEDMEEGAGRSLEDEE